MATPRPPADSSLADLFLAVQAMAGHPPLPWQVHVAEHTALLAGDQWAARRVGLVVARQNGKTDLIAARLIGGARFLGERCLYTTASGAAAVDTWRRLDEWVDQVPLLRRKLRDIKRSNGRERMLFAGGGVVQIATTGGRPPRGFDKVAALVYDEARELRTWAPVAALDPTQAAAPRSQRWLVSNAGDARSVVLNAARDAGRAAAAAGHPAPAWLEWSAPPGAAVDDPAALTQANPGLGITVRHVELLDAARDMPEAEFRTEHLCQWVELLDAVVDLAAWDALEDAEVPVPAAGALTLGFEVALDRSDAAICAAYTDTGRPVIQCVDHRPGTDWLIPRLLELLARWRAPVVAFGAGGPAPDLADELRRAVTPPPPGLDPVELVGFYGRDYAAACANLLARILDARLTHAHSGPVRDALAGAGTRPYTDAWVWSPRSSTTSVAALVAATCALWAHERAAVPLRPVVVAAPH